MFRLTFVTAVSTACASAALGQTSDSRLVALERQVSDQLARIEELESGAPDQLSTEAGGVELIFGGQVNAMILFAEQGPNDQAFVADNDASGSRLEFMAESTLNESLSAGLEIVVSAEVNSSDAIDFGSNQGAADESSVLGDFRQAHFYVESDRFGYISLGQGDTAAEDTAHVDLSGTDFAGAGSDVDDVAGGLHFFDDDGNDLGALDDFFDMQDGNRAVRVLYETPDFEGFSVVVSAENSVSGSDGGEDVFASGLQPAVALTYATEAGFGEFEAAVSWRRESLNDGVENEFVVGSASILLNSGINVTFAASRGDTGDQDVNPSAYFVKLGYLNDFFSIGETRFSVDYFYGENNADFGAPGGDLVDATSYGLFAVQEIAKLNTEGYVGLRRYALDDVYVDGTRRDVGDMTAVLAGARVRF